MVLSARPPTAKTIGTASGSSSGSVTSSVASGDDNPAEINTMIPHEAAPSFEMRSKIRWP